MTDQAHYFRLTPASIKPHMDYRSTKTLQRAKILVVEDDQHLMEGIKEILELDDYEVMTAGTGIDGLEVLKSVDPLPDLIVSDIMMPRMDGYEFFEAVRSEPKWVAIPFIFLTAKGEKSDIRLGKAMGADDYVTKPFGAEDLLIAVTAKLERHKQLQSVLSSQVADIKRKILTILNHEFRTPLTYVIAYADMLHRDADAMSLAEMREFLNGVSSGADRLRRLIENFIYLVEMETGEFETSFSWRKKPISDYKGLLDNSCQTILPGLKERRQELEIKIADKLPGIMGDWEYLSVALARLLDNASKFSKESTCVRVRVELDEEPRLCIRVIDEGRGIPNEELARIFDAFYQVNRQKFEDQGAGSGLAIVRGVAQVHNAEIVVESVVDEGSSFTLRFKPISQDVLK